MGGCEEELVLTSESHRETRAKLSFLVDREEERQLFDLIYASLKVVSGSISSSFRGFSLLLDHRES